MTDVVQDKRAVGAHQLWYASDIGFVIMIHNGVIDEVEAREIAIYLDDKSNGERLFFLADTRLAAGYTVEARKILATSKVVSRGVDVAIFGASPVVRVLFTLAVTAAKLVAGGKVTAHVSADEGPARAWLTERRRAYLAQKAST